MKNIALIVVTTALSGCAYDPFGNPVSPDDPGFGLIYIIGSAILAVMWLVGKFKKKDKDQDD